MDLDNKRNKNREALSAIKNEMSDTGELNFSPLCCQQFLLLSVLMIIAYGCKMTGV